MFLLVASYHFGKEDSDFIHKYKNNKIEILYFFKGSSIIFPLLLFHKEETIESRLLNFEISNIFFIENYILILFLIISFVATLLLSSKKNYELKLPIIINGLLINIDA